MLITVTCRCYASFIHLTPGFLLNENGLFSHKFRAFWGVVFICISMAKSANFFQKKYTFFTLARSRSPRWAPTRGMFYLSPQVLSFYVCAFRNQLVLGMLWKSKLWSPLICPGKIRKKRSPPESESVKC